MVGFIRNPDKGRIGVSELRYKFGFDEDDYVFRQERGMVVLSFK